MTKNQQISQTLKKTFHRRESQDCKVYEVKIDKSHLNNKQSQHLTMLFPEAKWLYNHILNLGDIFSFKDDSIKQVQVRNKDKIFEPRTLQHLSSQMKQSLLERQKQNVYNLSASKKKGNKVGALKFKSHVDSIPLKQYGKTYKIADDKHITIQGISGHIKVHGLEQIPKDAEYANAGLIRRQGDFYVHITCFVPKVARKLTGKSTGIDAGIKDNITLSNSTKFSVKIPETKRLKKLMRKFRNKVKFSKNWKKLKVKVRKEYDRITNRKKDCKNKIVSAITKEYDIVCIQDENIKAWHHGWFGKEVQQSILGGIMSDLKRKSHTLSIVDRFFPSTQLCPRCGTLNKIPLSERTYCCDCGYEADRDTHSAINIEIEGLKQLGMEYTKPMPVEDRTSMRESIPAQVPSCEAGSQRL